MSSWRMSALLIINVAAMSATIRRNKLGSLSSGIAGGESCIAEMKAYQ